MNSPAGEEHELFKNISENILILETQNCVQKIFLKDIRHLRLKQDKLGLFVCLFGSYNLYFQKQMHYFENAA